MTEKQKASTGLIIFSGLSFIPAIGILFGIISIIISFSNFKKFKIIFILGLSGIISSIIIYGMLYYFGSIQRGWIYDKLRASMDISLLQQIDKEMINYKYKYGEYPKSLIELKNESQNVIIEDPIILYVKNYEGDSLFYYESTVDSFVVFSVGMDGKPFTNDDIHSNDISELK